MKRYPHQGAGEDTAADGGSFQGRQMPRWDKGLPGPQAGPKGT